MNFLAFLRSSLISTEKLLPFNAIVFILRPISKALINSIPSIFSNLVCFSSQNFFSALGKKEICQKKILKLESLGQA